MLIPYQYSCVLSFACISTLLKVDQSVQTCHACCTLPRVSPCPWTSTATLSCHGHPGALEPGVLLWQLESGPVVPTCTPYCVNSALLHFLPSSCQSAVFWIWDENNGNHTLMFQLCTAARAALLARGLGHVKLGGDAARTADPSWPKGTPTAHGIMLTRKTGGKAGQSPLLRNRLGIPWGVVSRCFLSASLVFLGFYFPLSFYFPFHYNLVLLLSSSSSSLFYFNY